MQPTTPAIVVLNGGSSSIRFCIFHETPGLRRGLHGKLDRIGLDAPTLHYFDDGDGVPQALRFPEATDLSRAAVVLLQWLEQRGAFDHVTAVGHRVVHGMSHSQPEIVTDELLSALRGWQSVDPDHLPAEIALIDTLQKRFPDWLHVACFDTAFHHDMPRVAQMMALPRRFEQAGLRRYGFHGLSYAYLMEELERVAGKAVASGRVILAHFGNGASMAAVHEGRCVDTTMGFTPASGLPMGTRSGDLDPGMAAYLYRTNGLTLEQFDAMVNRESGLLGVSETSSDMQELLERENTDVRAAEAIALFCYQARKGIGAYAAALGGIDTLVFAGGIGENAAVVRERVCSHLEFLGIEIDAERNASHAGVISRTTGRVCVRVIRTDEESMIARAVSRVLGHAKPSAEIAS